VTIMAEGCHFVLGTTLKGIYSIELVSFSRFLFFVII
jgi:hypothetical protein